MMNKKGLIGGVLASALLVSAWSVQADDYKIDETHSFVQFRVKHLGYSWEYGRFSVIART